MMPAGSNFDTSWFAATIQLDGAVRESFPFGDGRELFDTGLKYLNKLTENTWRTKSLDSNIFVIYKVLLKFTKICLTNIWSHIYGSIAHDSVVMIL